MESDSTGKTGDSNPPPERGRSVLSTHLNTYSLHGKLAGGMIPLPAVITGQAEREAPV